MLAVLLSLVALVSTSPTPLDMYPVTYLIVLVVGGVIAVVLVQFLRRQADRQDNQKPK